MKPEELNPVYLKDNRFLSKIDIKRYRLFYTFSLIYQKIHYLEIINKMEATNEVWSDTKLMLVTANVGSLFEDVSR